MRSKRTILSIIAACMALLFLILDSKTALTGAYEGIELCIKTAIPSLFPFIMISVLLTGLLAGQDFPFLHPLGRMLRLPQNSEVLLLIGFLGGYPAGAHSIVQAYKSGVLSQKQAERMLSFCNNAGPAFIFGIGFGIIGEIWLCWLLWFIHILSAILTALLTPADDEMTESKLMPTSVTLTDAVQRSTGVITSVCGWIILFRTIIAFLQKWMLWLFPGEIKILLSGLLELTNGCCSLDSISSLGKRFIMFSVMLGFGGLCVGLQTKSVLEGTGLSSKSYFPGKAVQAAISLLLCSLATLFIPNMMDDSPHPFVILTAILICICYRIFATKSKKNIAFLPRVMYNGR